MSVFCDTGPVAKLLADGKRLHLQHGPIDLIIEAFGAHQDIEAAYRRAETVFRPTLVSLVDELPVLRAPTLLERRPRGAIALRMWRASLAHAAESFVTPMAAVAGAVADHVLAAMLDGGNLSRAYVNNGGDIALYIGEGQVFDIGVCAEPRQGNPSAFVRIDAVSGIGGVATSGWDGRSHSLGIADAVTVLANDAAGADAAATLIANRVDIPGGEVIKRRPASDLSSDSDLGDRLVTVGVGDLPPEDMALALVGGAEIAEDMCERGLIRAAFISLQGRSVSVTDGGIEAPLSSPVPGTGAATEGTDIEHQRVGRTV